MFCFREHAAAATGLAARGMLLALISVHQAHAVTPELHGRLFGNAYVPYGTARTTTNGDRLVQSDLEGWLTGSYAASEAVSTKGTFTLRNLSRPRDRIDFPTSATQQTEMGVREAYLRYSLNGFDLQAGKILLPWGKADGINPTDYFSAKDFRVANSDEEVRRVAPVAIVANLTPDAGASPVTITGVVAPVFAHSTLLIPSALIPAGTTVQAADPAPEFNIERMEAGVKLAYAGTGWDASVSGFTGWNHLADLGAPTLQGTSLVVTPRFRHVHAVGSDFSWTGGSYVIRGETSYRFTTDPSGTTGRTSPNAVDAVLGAERPFGDHFRAQLQGTVRWIPNFTPLRLTQAGTNPLDATTARLNAIFQNYQFGTLPGATLRISYSSDDQKTTAELFALAYFPSLASRTFNADDAGLQCLIRPKVTYAFTDSLSGTAGVDFYSGPNSTALGALEVYRSLFVEAKYVF